MMVSANASGMLLVVGRPAQTQMVHTFSTGLTQAIDISTLTATVPFSTFPTTATRYRMVSFELTLTDTNNQTSSQGQVLWGQIDSNLQTVAGVTYDTIADQHFVSRGKLAGRTIKAVAVPITHYAGTLAASSSSLAEWIYPMIFVSGGIANGQYSIGYHINWEYTPPVSMSDLLPTAPGPIGDPAAVHEQLNKMMGAGSGAITEKVVHGLRNGGKLLKDLQESYAKVQSMAKVASGKVDPIAMFEAISAYA
jgi:hypothetical protein